MQNKEELERLLNGPKVDEKPPGLLAEIEAKSEVEACKILDAARQVWAIVLKQDDPQSISLEEWRELLPQWFVEKCGPEISMDEAMRRRGLPMEERIKLAETWTLGAWIHWLSPSERHWFWWDAKIGSPSLLIVNIVVDGFPFPSGSLQWLLKCCGAKSVEVLG